MSGNRRKYARLLEIRFELIEINLKTPDVEGVLNTIKTYSFALQKIGKISRLFE
jgi:hypothetical protein